MNKKGQLKIQEMAFVLVALIIFMALVGLLFVKFRTAGLENQAQDILEESTDKLILSLASSPELGWAGCQGCIDLDKALFVQRLERETGRYSELWELDYLALERIYPLQSDSECNLGNYPNCNLLEIVEGEDFGVASNAFVSLCRLDFDSEKQVCELGRIYASGRSLG